MGQGISRRFLLASAAFVAGQGKAHTGDFSAGDVGYVERPSGHYIQNTGTGALRFLEIFASDHYAEVTLADWTANTPRELVAAHLGIDRNSAAGSGNSTAPGAAGIGFR